MTVRNSELADGAARWRTSCRSLGPDRDIGSRWLNSRLLVCIRVAARIWAAMLGVQPRLRGLQTR
ncbi:MAG: hypothetical protein EBY28_19300 [Betaproteobacteria bacterium]|nr:hypothetical protein [Betaproteobacteria bacterium]